MLHTALRSCRSRRAKSFQTILSACSDHSLQRIGCSQLIAVATSPRVFHGQAYSHHVRPVNSITIPSERRGSQMHSYSKLTAPIPIHIAGHGNVGKFIGHSLAKEGGPQNITFMVHNPEVYNRWTKEGMTIEMATNDTSLAVSGFNFEPLDGSYEHTAGHIRNLIVCTKAFNVSNVLTRLKPRLNQRSNILFTQNGLGFIEEVNEHVFPDMSARPTYIAGIISHGLYSEPSQKVSKANTYQVRHAGFGKIALGVLPKNASQVLHVDGTDPAPQEVRSEHLEHFLQHLLVNKTLAMSELSLDKITIAQLGKLAVNAVVNPLTACFEVHNGYLLNDSHIETIMDGLLKEIYAVYTLLPEIQVQNSLRSHFTREKLKENLQNVISITANNYSSMYADVMNGKQTEISYINGYIARRGQELGVQCPYNSMLVEMVSAKSLLKSQEKVLDAEKQGAINK
jgi:2-dehydropantoate 2-reductase